jgi:DnaK suppressor protein
MPTKKTQKSKKVTPGKKMTKKKKVSRKSKVMPKKKVTLKKKVTTKTKGTPKTKVTTKRKIAPKTPKIVSRTKATTKVKKVTKASPREKKIREIKKNLISQKKALLAGALEALNELPGPTVFPDLGDQATAEIDRNFMLRLRGRERKLLKKIDEAIERIDQGVFGICDKCGLDIDIRRLEARPVTTMCIECKILQEEEEKLREG